jgi:anthranilate synthase/aminodeoxychorismate synthase-like glutamine amidotransferase
LRLALSASLLFHGSVRVLFLENDDSFTWNVVDALPVPRGDVVLRSGSQVASEPGSVSSADVIVLGPGPTDPIRAGIVGVVRWAEQLRKPLLGICLGHQAVGLAYGAALARVPPAHGKRTTITFERSRMFPHFTGPETVMRYNSLALAEVRAPLRVIARAHDGTAMAVEHDSLPIAGLQFHPDSFGTPRGREMIADFFEVVR